MNDETVVAHMLSAPLPQNICPSVIRFPSPAGTRQWTLCTSVLPEKSCTTVSIGGIRVSSHLESQLAHRDCTVYAFDSTLAPSSWQALNFVELHRNAKFHSLQSGSSSEPMPLSRALSVVGGSVVDVLKIDCDDGCEWKDDNLLDSTALDRVNQLLVQLHFHSPMFSISAAAKLFRHIRRKGFEMFVRDVDPWSAPVPGTEKLLKLIHDFAGASTANQLAGTQKNMIRLGTEAGFGYSEEDYEVWRYKVKDDAILCCFKLSFVRTTRGNIFVSEQQMAKDSSSGIFDNVEIPAPDPLARIAPAPESEPVPEPVHVPESEPVHVHVPVSEPEPVFSSPIPASLPQSPSPSQLPSPPPAYGYPHAPYLGSESEGKLVDEADIIAHRLLAPKISDACGFTKQFEHVTGNWSLCVSYADGKPVIVAPSCLMYSLGGSEPSVDKFLSKDLKCESHIIDDTHHIHDWQYADISVSDGHWRFSNVDEFSAIRAENGHADTIIDVLKIDTQDFDFEALTEDVLDGIRQLLITVHMGHGMSRVASLFERFHNMGFEVIGWSLNPFSSATDRSLQVMEKLRSLIGDEKADLYSVSENSLRNLGQRFQSYQDADRGSWFHTINPHNVLCCYRLALLRRNVPSKFRPIPTDKLLARPSTVEPRRPPVVVSKPIVFNFGLGINRVVLSFTTIPSRIHLIGPAIEGIKSQSFQLDAIYIHLPRKMKRFDMTFTIPDFLKNDPDIILNWTEEDYGPSTKLLATLLVEKDPSTIIITIDDDFVPFEHFTRNLLNGVQRFQQAAIGFGGWNVTCVLDYPCPRYGVHGLFYGNYMFIRQGMDDSCNDWNKKEYGEFHCVRAVTNIDHPEPADVLEGYMGIAYRRGFFDDAIFNDYSKAPPESFFVDDVWISGHLAMRGVQRLVVLQSFDMESIVVDKIGTRHNFPYKFELYTGERTNELSERDPDSLHGTVGNFVEANRIIMKYFRDAQAW
jgi:hypothetical protein